QFERSAALLPTPEAYGALAETLARAGRFAEAASRCDQLVALAPDDAGALRLAAAVYQRVSRGAEADELERRAAALAATAPPADGAPARRPAIYRFAVSDGWGGRSRRCWITCGSRLVCALAIRLSGSGSFGFT